ncbi:MAG: glycosyltransferase [Dehalococcoidia bacterium]
MEDKLKIAILSLHTCPFDRPGSRYTGGMNIYIQNLAQELGRRGHSIDIYTCSHADDDFCTLVDGSDNVRLIHIKSPEYSSISEKTIGDHIAGLTDSIALYCLERGEHYDLIHSHYWLSGVVGSKLKQKWCIPHITMFHTLGAVKNSLGLGILEPEYRIFNEHVILGSTDLVIASTLREKHELINRYNANPAAIEIVPCGINHALFRPIDQQTARQMCGLAPKKTALFVGRLDPLKALGNLLEAISYLKSRDDFQLLVVGGNDHGVDFQAITDAACDYEVSHSVNFIGSVPHERMYLYYNAADFCVIPSYYESFGLVALESLACGTPIIATDVGEVRDIAGICQSCRIITGNTPLELSTSIKAMLDQIGSRKNGYQNLAELYGWDHVVDKILQLYRSVIDRNAEFAQELCSYKP